MPTKDELPSDAPAAALPSTEPTPQHRLAALPVSPELRAMLQTVRQAAAERAGLTADKLPEAEIRREALAIGLNAMGAGMGITVGEPRVALSPAATKALQAAQYLQQRGALPAAAMKALRELKSGSPSALVEVALRLLVSDEP